MTDTTRPRIGDRVLVLSPHGEAGAIGTVMNVYRANDNYPERARVFFAPGRDDGWIEGTMTVDLGVLEVIPEEALSK